MVPPCGTPARARRARRSGGPRRPIVRRTTAITSSYVRLALASCDGVRQAAVDVVLEHQHPHLVRGRGLASTCWRTVQAVGLVLDQPLEAARLALDPPQAVEELLPVAGVAVAEVGGVRIGSSYWWAVCRRPVAPVNRASDDGPVSPLERHELIDPLERVLVVVSHPDDAEFGAGPTIALLAAWRRPRRLRRDHRWSEGHRGPVGHARSSCRRRGAPSSGPPRTSSACPTSSTSTTPMATSTPTPRPAARRHPPDPPLPPRPRHHPEPPAPARPQPVHRPSGPPRHRGGHARIGLSGGSRPPELPRALDR